MRQPRIDWLQWLTTSLLVAACGCLLGSILVGLGHPLFWNDEGMTVMHARRVWEHGYPLAWDGKNMVYDLLHPDKELGLDKATGAFIGGSGWGHYYFAAPFVALADAFEDDHQRTGFIRLWFALAGLLGLWVTARMVGRAIPKRRQRHAAWLAFTLGCLLSIPLALHLREARYYSLTVLLVGLILALHARRQIFHDFQKAGLPWRHLLLMTLLLLALLFTFAPAFLAMMATLGIAALVAWMREAVLSGSGGATIPKRLVRLAWPHLRGNLHLLVCAVALVPFLYFFQTLHINAALMESNTRLSFYSHYTANLMSILGYLWHFEPFLLLLVLKLALLAALPALLRGRNPETQRQLRLSGLLAMAFVCLMLFAARIPNDMFIRYYVALIPLLFAQVALDGILLWNWLCPRPRTVQAAALMAFLGLLAWPIRHNLKHIQGHWAELRTPVAGHLDLMIPFLKERYPDTSSLVMAANYEETCFMYYLDAKVTVGYVQPRLEEDLRHKPDVIYFNSYWRPGEINRAMDYFLATSKYGRAVFPIGRYRVNNIPEVNYKPELEHQYRTRKPEDSEDQAELLLRLDGGMR